MNIRNLQSIVSACELVLTDAKNGNEKSLLSNASHNLKYCVHISRTEKATQSVEKKVNTPQEMSTLPDPLKKFITEYEEVARLGLGCKLVLQSEIKNSASNRNTRALKASLELVTLLFNSGVIPTNLSCSLPDTENDENEAVSPFLSKLLGPRVQKECTLSNSDSKVENVFVGISECILDAAETISLKVSPDRLYDSVLSALQASIAPKYTRGSLSSSVLGPNILNLTGEKLYKAYDFMLKFAVFSASINNSISCFEAVGIAIVNELEKRLACIDGENLLLSSKLLQDDLIFLIKSSCNTLEKYFQEKKNDLSCEDPASRSILALWNVLLSSEVVLKSGAGLIHCIENQVLPVLLRITETEDHLLLSETLNLLQFFCRSTGLYKKINASELVFSRVYLKFLRKCDTSDEKKALVCRELKNYLQLPTSIMFLFIHRESSFSLSLLEEVVDALCRLLGRGADSIISEDTQKNDLMGILASSKLDFVSYLSSGKADSHSSEVVERAAIDALICLVVSASKWVGIKSKIVSDHIDNSLSNENQSKFGDCVPVLELIYVAHELFNNFLYIFNVLQKPEKAISCLEECSNVGEDNVCLTANPGEECRTRIVFDCHAKAALLKKCDGCLDKVTLGQYFAKCLRSPEILNIFTEWIALHHFRDLSVDEAMRVFLGGFKLVGEAQVVDKTMELFSRHYWSENPSSVFSCPDVVFILSFSICMLNTDAHSPHIKNKMKLEEFLQNNRGIDEGKDVENKVLEGIYERIVRDEIVLRENNNKDFFGGTHAGILEHILSQSEFLVPDISWKSIRELFIAESCEEWNLQLVGWTDVKNLQLVWMAVGKMICYTVIGVINLTLLKSEFHTDPTATQVSNIAIFAKNPENRIFFSSLRSAVFHLVRLSAICNMTSTLDWIFVHLYCLSKLFEAVRFRQHRNAHLVEIGSSPTSWRLELVVTLINCCRVYGNHLSTLCWFVGYCTMSLLDATANGVEGLWCRCVKDLRKSMSKKVISESTKKSGESGGSGGSILSPLPPDRWFGDLGVIPSSIKQPSNLGRSRILSSIRSASTASVDVWLEHLFDTTQFSEHARVRMTTGLLWCSQVELKQGRGFSLNKVVEFLTVSNFTPGKSYFHQLWDCCAKVYVIAGQMHMSVAIPALEDLLVIILGCLREEPQKLAGSQKALLEPLEKIYSSTPYEEIQQKVFALLRDITQRCPGLEAGWQVVLECVQRAAQGDSELSHKEGWDFMKHIATARLSNLTPLYLTKWMECIGEYSMSKRCSEVMGLEAVSLLVACGRWVYEGSGASGGFPSGSSRDIACWGIELLTERKLREEGRSECGSFDSSICRCCLWCTIFSQLAGAAQHASPRVRAHTISSMMSLLERYGSENSGLGSEDILPVEQVLRDYCFPVVLRVIQTFPKASESSTFDQIDYRTLVQLALKGLLSAAVHLHQPEVLSCVFAFLHHSLLEDTALITSMAKNDFFCVIVGVLRDLFSAVDLPNDAVPSELAGSSTGPLGAIPASRNPDTLGAPISFLQYYKDINDLGAAVFSEDLAFLYDPGVLSWLEEYNRSVSLSIQTSVRTCEWLEVHHTPAASSSHISHKTSEKGVGGLSEFEAQIKDGVVECFHRLISYILAGLDNEWILQQHLSLARRAEELEPFFVAYRQVLLSCGDYCIQTGDVRGLGLIQKGMSLLSCDEARSCMMGTLLLIPATVGVGELTWACGSTGAVFNDPEAQASALRMIEEMADLFFSHMILSRAYVIEHREQPSTLENEKGILEGSLTKRTSLPVTTSLSFGTMFSMSSWLSTDADTNLEGSPTESQEDREVAKILEMLHMYHVWNYTLRLVAIKLLLALPCYSVLLSTLSWEFALDTVKYLPSVLEETSVRDTWKYLWNVLHLGREFPHTFLMIEWVQRIKEEISTGVKGASVPVRALSTNLVSSTAEIDHVEKELIEEKNFALEGSSPQLPASEDLNGSICSTHSESLE